MASNWPGSQDNDTTLGRYISTDAVVPNCFNNYTDAIEAMQATLQPVLGAPSGAAGQVLTLVNPATPSYDWTTVGGGGGSGLPLGVTSYVPGSDIYVDGTLLVFTPLDAVNLTVAFTAPSSGNVLVRISGFAYQGSGGGNTFFGVLEAGVLVTGSQLLASAVNGAQAAAVYEMYLSGVSAGAHTYQLGYKVGTSGTTIGFFAGPTSGAVNLAVYEW